MPPRKSDRGSEESGYEKAQRAVEGTPLEDPIRRQWRELQTPGFGKPQPNGGGGGSSDGGSSFGSSYKRDGSALQDRGGGSGSPLERGTSLPDKSSPGRK